MCPHAAAQRARLFIRPHNAPVAGTEIPESGDPGLTVAAVARRLGVAPATLRTWDRRYGLGPSAHESGAHRRYCAEDVARLEHMRRLVVNGVAPGDAAREALAMQVIPSAPLPRPVLSIVRNDDSVGDLQDLRPLGDDVDGVLGSPAVRGLARSALTLDTATCQAIIDDSIASRGVIWTWDHLLVPVLIGVGERWEATGRGVEIEHALSAAVQSSLIMRTNALKDPVNARAVLLSGADEEEHTLPLWAAAAALAERGIAVRVLGERMPLDALIQAVRRTGPAAIFLWSHIPGSADATTLSALPSFRPTPLILIGGQGWVGTPPKGVHRVDGLVDVVERIERALVL